MSLCPNYQHYKRFQDCSRSDESITIFANFIGDVFRFVPASLEAYPPAEFLVGRVIYLPRVITLHKAEKNFVKKQMVNPFCGGQRLESRRATHQLSQATDQVTAARKLDFVALIVASAL